MLTSSQRREILNTEYRTVVAGLTPNWTGRLSGAQLAAAKGIAKRRALAIIDARCAA